MLSIRVGDRTGEVPGLQSVATAIGTPWRRSRSTGGLRRLAQRVEGAGQQHRDHARRCAIASMPGLVGMLEMVGRERAEFGRERGAVEVARAARHGA